MKPKKSIKTLLKLFTTVLFAVVILAFCTSSVLALFSNAGFETGNFTGWTQTKFLNTGLTLPQPFTGADINRGPGGDDLSAVLGPFAQMSQTDPHTGGVLHFPRSGSYCARVNSDQAYGDGGHPQNANTIKQTDMAAAGDVAPDGMIHVQIAWAAVVQNPPHTPDKQPYIYVSCWNTTKNILLYETFIFAGQSGTIWQNAPNAVQFTDWQVIDRAFTSDNITIGDNIEIEAIAAGCEPTGHWGYLYVDPFGSFYPVTPSITAANKPYDTTTTATITGSSLTGVESGDDVSLTIGAANFDTKDVGNGKTVTATGLNLTGADAGKYMLTSFTATTTANITPLVLTVTGITANNKVYDGNTTATLNTAGATLVGVLPGDTVTLNTAGATGTFSDPNPGVGKVVTVAGLTIGGDDAGNYVLTQPTTTASISAQPIVTSVGPASGAMGECLTVTITGSGFTGATAVNFGTGITVNSFTVVSDTQITAYICITADAALGVRDISVTTPRGAVMGTALFTVNGASAPPAPKSPRASPAPTLSRPFNPALLSIQYVSVNPQQTSAGQPVTIATNVINTGDQASNYNVTLKINGQAEQTRMGSIGPQGTQPLKFTVTKAQPGTYAVDIGGQRGSFVVLGAGDTAGAPVNGGLIVILIMGVLILASVVVLLISRRTA